MAQEVFQETQSVLRASSIPLHLCSSQQFLCPPRATHRERAGLLIPIPLPGSLVLLSGNPSTSLDCRGWGQWRSSFVNERPDLHQQFSDFPKTQLFFSLQNLSQKSHRWKRNQTIVAESERKGRKPCPPGHPIPPHPTDWQGYLLLRAVCRSPIFVISDIFIFF